jgi:hypothetical protein
MSSHRCNKLAQNLTKKLTSDVFSSIIIKGSWKGFQQKPFFVLITPQQECIYETVIFNESNYKQDGPSAHARSDSRIDLGLYVAQRFRLDSSPY